MTQRVTPSRRNTKETKRLSLRFDRVEEPTPTLDPVQGDPIAKALRNTTDGDRRRTKRRRRKKTEPRQWRGKLDWRQTTEHKTTVDLCWMREPRHP